VQPLQQKAGFKESAALLETWAPLQLLAAAQACGSWPKPRDGHTPSLLQHQIVALGKLLQGCAALMTCVTQFECICVF